MKIQGTPTMKTIFWHLLASILVLISFSHVTEAQLLPQDPGFSLSPNPPIACETLTVGWNPANASFYGIQIFDNGDNIKVLQTGIHTPTSSFEWLVAATNLASLHIELVAFASPSPVTPELYLTTDVGVRSGSTACALLVSTVISQAAIPAPSASLSLTTPVSPARTAPALAAPTSQNATAATTSTSPSLLPTASSFIRVSQPQTVTPGDLTNSGPPVSTNPPGSTPTTSPSTTSPSLLSSPAATPTNDGPPHSPNPGTIVGVVIASLAGIAFILLALCLFRRGGPRRRTGDVHDATPYPASYVRRPPPRSFLAMDRNGLVLSSEHIIYQELHTPVDDPSSSIPLVYLPQFGALDSVAHGISQSQREGVDGLAVSEKFSGERRNREERGASSTLGGVREQTRMENFYQRSTIVSDSSESTLPPPYSSHYGDSET